MRLELLGPLRIWNQDAEVLPGPPKQRAVLALLASRANQVVGVGKIIDAVWGSRVPPTAVNGVHTYVAGLRRALEPGRGPRASADLLVSAAGGYSLRLGPEAVDAELFVRRHARARQRQAAGDRPGAVRAYEAALALWQGEAYGNVPGPFADLERARLHELRLTAVEEWAAAMLAVARHAEAAAVLSDQVAREPLRERPRWLLMLALYRCGRRAHALDLYRQTRRLLREELGIEPGPDLRRLQAQILAGRPEPTPTPTPDQAPAPDPAPDPLLAPDPGSDSAPDPGSDSPSPSGLGPTPTPGTAPTPALLPTPAPALLPVPTPAPALVSAPDASLAPALLPVPALDAAPVPAPLSPSPSASALAPAAGPTAALAPVPTPVSASASGPAPVATPAPTPTSVPAPPPAPVAAPALASVAAPVPAPVAAPTSVAAPVAAPASVAAPVATPTPTPTSVTAPVAAPALAPAPTSVAAPVAAPALAVAPAPAQLPASARGFTGRGEELARLRNAVLAERARPDAPAALAVIEGVAGVGKSATALRLAHHLAPHCPDGQLFVDLGGTSAPREPLTAWQALGQLLGGLGVPGPRQPRDLPGRTALYRSLLHGRRVLLVLDDALSPEQVRPLVPRGPACVLVTSRLRQYGLAARDGAYRIELAPLPLEDCLELLGYLAGHQRLAADPAGARALARLCGRLPLPLRVTAEALVTRPGLPLAALVAEHARAEERLDKLAVEGDLAASVRSAFAASFRRLPADAARMFKLLGRRPRGPVTAAQAAALCGAGPVQAARLLRVLADHHLLEEAGQDGGYRFHDLVGLFAAELAHSDPPPPPAPAPAATGAGAGAGAGVGGGHRAALGRLPRTGPEYRARAATAP